ncbi:MAG: hypothetical protein PUF60_10870 [Firmicutes bacterium]|nr:hypothetical protein [Bacillota bacterium]
MIVTAKEYVNDRIRFFEKHDYNYRVDTSPMDEYGRYSKTYNFTDGAQWFEVMSPEYVEHKIEVKLVKTTVEIKLFKTEYWSTESGSKYCYEKF